jgi:hypothetical protein
VDQKLLKSQDARRVGPLKLPAPPDVASHKAAERLYGHTTSPTWLPEGVWPELDALRDEQHRLRAQVAAELDSLDALEAQNRREDSHHAEALRQAHRDGTPDAVNDERTPAEDRAAKKSAIEERLWAGVQVFAEHADRVIETLREKEDAWLGDLRSRLTPAQEKRRRAQELLAEARAEEFHLGNLGRWLQATSDDHAFGRQPAPPVGEVPEQVSPEVLRRGLERPWHEVRDWAKTPVTAE